MDEKYSIVIVKNRENKRRAKYVSSVIKVIDQHIGFEEFWNDKIRNNANIEFIGVAATLVFEEYEKNNMQNNKPF